jgi:haloacetate dehalogenase
MHSTPLDLQHELFPAFEHHRIRTTRGTINAVVGGTGPPLLLLHGYPESLLMWHATAPLLAHRHTVVAADLAGYGASFKPWPATDRVPHSKRAMALDQVELMTRLGHDRFAVAGHDRGGRVAYRMALDHPDRVSRLAVLDVVPTGDVWARIDPAVAHGYWHWSFLAQPAPLPERLIAGDPGAFFALHVQEQLGMGEDPGRYPPSVLAAYRRALEDGAAVRAMCEDYRAGATVDVEHDEADRAAGRRIDCPLLVLWAGRGGLPRFYPDVLDVWRPWAADVRGRAIDARHFLAEDRPAETAEELLRFLTATSAVTSPALARSPLATVMHDRKDMP